MKIVSSKCLKRPAQGDLRTRNRKHLVKSALFERKTGNRVLNPRRGEGTGNNGNDEFGEELCIIAAYYA